MLATPIAILTGGNAAPLYLLLAKASLATRVLARMVLSSFVFNVALPILPIIIIATNVNADSTPLRPKASMARVAKVKAVQVMVHALLVDLWFHFLGLVFE